MAAGRSLAKAAVELFQLLLQVNEQARGHLGQRSAYSQRFVFALQPLDVIVRRARLVRIVTDVLQRERHR